MADLETRVSAIETWARSFPRDGVVIPPGGGNPPGSVTVPADLLNLTNWKLTLPTANEDGKIDEIFQPELARYSSLYFALTDQRDGVRFRCWHGQNSTRRSLNPRSELREMLGKELAGWNPRKGTHTLRLTGSTNRLTKVKPETVTGQIHDEANDICTFRVERNKLWVTRFNETNQYLVTDDYALGDPYALTFTVTDSTIFFSYNDRVLPYEQEVKGSSTKWYFRAGAYLQSNPTTAPGESNSEYTETVIRTLSVTHE